VEYILKNSLLRRTLDNVTVVLIAFSNFKYSAFGEGKKNIKGISEKQVQQSRNNEGVGVGGGGGVGASESKLVTEGRVDMKKENVPP
jgi:hypothetical protein